MSRLPERVAPPMMMASHPIHTTTAAHPFPFGSCLLLAHVGNHLLDTGTPQTIPGIIRRKRFRICSIHVPI